MSDEWRRNLSIEALKLMEVTHQFYDADSLAQSESDRRARDRAGVVESANACDCWREAGPICARCKLPEPETGE